MSELMTLREAFDKANEDDYLKETTSGIDFPKRSINGVSIDGIPAISDKWEVITAEPEVLTAGKWALMEYGENGKHDYFIDDIEESFEAGDKNGQLRYKELRDKVQLYVDDPDVLFHESGIAEALEKLNQQPRQT